MGTGELYIPRWDNYAEVDPGPTKEYFKVHRNDPEFAEIWELGFGKVPGEELYYKRDDPEMIHNLAGDPAYAHQKVMLREELEAYLRDTDDPRSRGLSPWDNYNLDKPPPEKKQEEK